MPAVSPKSAPVETQNTRDPDRLAPYGSSVEHILAELQRIDILVEAQVRRAREVQKEDDLQGLYISEQEVDGLLARPVGLPRWAMVQPVSADADVHKLLARMRDHIDARKAATTSTHVALRLSTLAERFRLTSFEIDVVLMCLAAELDLKYERLYAYLQDDVTKKRPSVDLALNLLCSSFAMKIDTRDRFGAEAPLIKEQIISLIEDSSTPKPSLLSRYLKLDERVVSYLLDRDDLDLRLIPYVSVLNPKRSTADLLLPPDLLNRFKSLIDEGRAGRKTLNIYLQGPYGVGKRLIAEALARAAGLNLLIVDGARILASTATDFTLAVRYVMREAIFQDAAICWIGFDSLLAEDQSIALKAFVRELQSRNGLTFLAGETTWEPTDLKHLSPFLRVEIPRPSYAERVQLWQRSLDGWSPPNIDSDALANKFRFTGGQIRDAANTARNLAYQRNPENPVANMADLFEACRLQSNRKLATLATNIKPHYSWDHIVLPADRMRQLREICRAVEYRSLVYDEWGFGDKLSLGKGLSVLFAGPSGTGKTMAAEIIGRELALDVYKIDLSTVVSKYIGETEKNLARIFTEATTSNSILFFDEADALFGKRSEVRDAHDRYANIEINYLLQKMEEYDGIVILATNFRKNMDEAFVRRIQATIEFPFPDADDRLRIWQRVWPENTPCADLDLECMATRFQITGGNIRNIALSAAFLAAEDGACVRMKHLMRATLQEYQKMGKIIMEEEFSEYGEVIEDPRIRKEQD
jgi:SpoVK/Ycf46/Vps4 family AAA+-type ATPase